MNTTRKWMAAVAILVMAGAAAAQFGRRAPGPQMKGVWAPVVGSGAAYEVDGREGKMEMEFAIVGVEHVGNKQGHWLEMSIKGRQGAMVQKMLVVLESDRIQIKRMIMDVPGEGAMEFPMDMMARMGQSTDQGHGDISKEADVVGPEAITTPAGTFQTTHYRAKDKSADFWVSEKVAPYGLVKMTSKDGNMTLVRVLTNATTKIKGTPRKFDMGMPPQ